MERKKLVTPEWDDDPTALFQKVRKQEKGPRAPVKGLAFLEEKWVFILV